MNSVSIVIRGNLNTKVWQKLNDFDYRKGVHTGNLFEIYDNVVGFDYVGLPRLLCRALMEER